MNPCGTKGRASTAYRMPVWIAKSETQKRPRENPHPMGSSFLSTSRRQCAPNGIEARRQADPVVPLPICDHPAGDPTGSARRNTRATFFAGSLQGVSATQTGVTARASPRL